MARAKHSSIMIVALAAVFVGSVATTVYAEPYGGFDTVERKYIRIDYGPRYQTTETTVRYADPPDYVTYRRTYTEPAYESTTIVHDTAPVRHVTPVRYRRVYAAPRHVVHVGPYARYWGPYHPRPYACRRPYGCHRPHVYARPYAYRRPYAYARPYMYPRPYAHGYHRAHHGHHRPYPYYGHHRYHGHHPRAWGFNLAGGQGYHGGHHGGFSFFYSG
jgi:hypothetical protein